MNRQMIINLIARDFRAYNGRIALASIGALVMGMVMIFINTNLSRMFAGSTSIILISIILPFIAELKDHSVWVQTASLPVSRKAMVIARLVISLLIGSINLIIWIVSYTVLMEVLRADTQYALTANLILTVSMQILFSIALFYFAYYRFNFMGAMGFYLMAMMLPQLIQLILMKTTSFVIEDFRQPIALSVITIFFFTTSIFSSLTVFPRRDL